MATADRPKVVIKTGPECPSCKIAMVLRTAKKGKHEGNQFWGCRKFPNCRCVAQYDPDAPLIEVDLSKKKSERHVSFMALVAQRKKNMW